jgi:hypothetical protein
MLYKLDELPVFVDFPNLLSFTSTLQIALSLSMVWVDGPQNTMWLSP